MRTTKIIDQELELAELAILEGGLVGKKLANRLLGNSQDSKEVYEIAKSGKIDSWAIGGTIYFSAIDCVMFRRKKERIGGYTRIQNQGKA